ncbi:hypothetical protein N7448_004239 [Penicillium atrosanguineum]|uniref:Uncharacterized protein n=1 Tax=Penicillium atrosanguineum TaxID=1132637 RepID=A0A9W9H974_9EURO|nr:uncharacterized protein N7443_003204 [Penicillium atrosanguineum]KAJ5118114.1 hypothetical protein N7526_011137 [Penicillium atrosanguineum]KAJ5140831.1 hypothetical protein N7448_004239 [Penicillium atrosanguineum]KAJ5310743.1 hypothetical protein N7443_003204 [Penicillium atrosanguineum]KAJ5316266.1 hypothetical protein N7476_006573 [Penicillium atrosanguineum]
MRLSLALPLVAGLLVSVSGIKFSCPKGDIEDSGCLGPKECLYPYAGNCDKFIECEVNSDGTGRPMIGECPAGLEWNDNKKECDLPEDSTCSDDLQEVEDETQDFAPPPKGTVDENFDCSSAPSGGCMKRKGRVEVECIYPNPKNSISYIQCTDGIAWIVKCDQPLSRTGHYNDALKACILKA